MTPTLERSTVHISDDTGRIAMLEKRNPAYASDASEPALTRYIYSNHLQSASLELDEKADIISYEEYHPYGTTAYQASNGAIKAVAKRYRYTGKERDEESGLYYHGARYYIPWLARWTAVDPMESKYAGMSPYNYSFNNPVMFNDPSGADPKDGNKSLMAADATAMAPRVQMPLDVDTNKPLPDIGGFLSGIGSSQNQIILAETVIVSTVDNANVNIPYYGNQEILTGLAAQSFNENPVLFKAVSQLGISNSASYISQSRHENSYEKSQRQYEDWQDQMMQISQANPLIGAYYFATSDVVGTIEAGRSAYESFSDREYGKGTVYAGLTLLSVSGYGGGISKNVGRAGKLLSEAKLAANINALRQGEDITVSSIEHARQILHNMDELVPHVNNFPSNAGELFHDTPFLNKVWKQPKGTYRGDLINTSEKNYSKFVHDPVDVGKNIDHAYNPHYNIIFPSGKKAAIIIR